MKPDLQVVEGGGDIVTTLEDMLVRARAGEIEGLVICVCQADKIQTRAIAWRDDMAFPWTRLLASVAGVHHELLTEGL